jgi:2,3-bisphosphoglycerate-independent phosphoglycerate mutase
VNFDYIRRLQRQSESKVVLLVLDGLGGVPISRQGVLATELEAALTPNLDRLAAAGLCGLHVPVGPGITPGSGPAHLALFGYDPLTYEVGRGVLSALGIGFDLRDGDVAARGNFCTVDDAGRVTDRRAGRIDSETNRELCDRLREIDIEGVEISVETVKEYRFLLVLRGDDLSPAIGDTDPQAVEVKPRDAEASQSGGRRTAAIVRRFVEEARQVLADQDPANMILLRGFSTRPSWPQLPSIYGVRAAAVAAYPMYRGVAALVGMEVLEAGDDLDGELDTVADRWSDFDFFFVHVKKTDSAGEDGDFGRKVELIEAVDRALPKLLDLEPDVLVVTGDHSTPSTMRSHSWHPVPVLLRASTCRPDRADQFGETACLRGGLGVRLPATHLMPLAFAHAGRLGKFGA